MTILPEMYVWTRKIQLNFGSHPDPYPSPDSRTTDAELRIWTGFALAEVCALQLLLLSSSTDL